MNVSDNGAPPKPDTSAPAKEPGLVPTLELAVVSRNGATPSNMAGCLLIPVEDGAGIQEKLHDIVRENVLPVAVDWHVYVSIDLDDLDEPVRIERKDGIKVDCNKCVRVNALLSFSRWLNIPNIYKDYQDEQAKARKISELNKTVEKLLKDEPEVRRIKIKSLPDGKYIDCSRVRAGTIDPGEWLLPVKAGEKLLAYVRVKIEDKSDVTGKAGKADKADVT